MMVLLFYYVLSVEVFRAVCISLRAFGRTTTIVEVHESLFLQNA